MIRSFVLLLLSTFSFTMIGISQFGLNMRYSSNEFRDWSRVTTAASGGPIWDNHMEFGLDYWFRPGKYRAEYMIEGSYSRTRTIFSGSINSLDRIYQLQSFGFGVKSNIYILDFTGDCDCPTIIKDGATFKKGFYLQWNAHAAYWNKKADFLGSDDNNLAIDIGGGAGFDIGISEMLTISPYVSYQYYPWLTWVQFGLRHGIGGIDNLNAKTTVTMLKVGVRLGFRPDYLKEKRVLTR